ncbi:related to scramblase family protein [Ramularia collo-cygni]|uniref:Related to scramblase family protein n=1 Tax=Ramularia collo-cygni TaxID=112498 RepID=A0A2D3UUZ2_9PEZI|nr:related to scramblase family protein [Ramularia collo-cygni]CZT21482.1 related to scramblase family protein [Ramularia collo-cygni]
MSAARWALRLPRARLLSAPRPAQRRFLRSKPRIIPRASSSNPSKGIESNEIDNRRIEVPKHEETSPSTEAAPSTQSNEPATPPSNGNAALSAALASSPSSDLISEVHIPHDPHSVLPSEHPALSLLANSSLIIQRQMEMMNLLIGFEQANRYIIMDPHGATLGYIAEQDHGIGRSLVRQLARTHRSFTTHIFDKEGREVLRIHRPFAWISSRIRIYDCVPEGGYKESEETGLQTQQVEGVPVSRTSPLKLEEMRIIGEAQQQWAPLRRKYNLFTFREEITTAEVPPTETTTPDSAIESGMAQFASINEPFLSWDFTLRNDSSAPVGSVNRNFSGFAREIFTDTGVYALRMDSAAQTTALESADGKELERHERDGTAMTLDQRAVMLATAISIDFDYFSRHSGQGGGMGMMPFMWPMGGGAAEGGAVGGAVGGAAGEAGAIEGAAGAAGAAGRGIAGSAGSEGAVAGMGTMAGYEAMQRGAGGQAQSQAPVDDASPTAGGNDPFDAGGADGGVGGGSEDLWGESGDPWGQSQDPWGGQGGGGGGEPPASGGGDAGGGEGGGWLDTISDFFGD